MRVESWVYTIPLRLRSLFRRRLVEQELDDELQYHLHCKTADYVSKGLREEEARRAALLDMQGLTQRKEECRDARRVNLVDDTLQDIRYGLRILARTPGPTALAVLTLALAIGANAVVFALFQSLIARPLNVPRAETLYSLERKDSNSGRMSYPDYLDFRDRNRSFEGLAAYEISPAGLDTGSGNPSSVYVCMVSGNYFDVLGIQPQIGRVFHASDERGPNSAPYVVLSHRAWRERFSADPLIVGRTVQLNKHPYTVLGVTPPEFRGTLLFFSAEIFTPFVNQEQITGVNHLNERRMLSVFLTMGHLKPGVTPAQAIDDINAIGAQIEKTYPTDVARMRFTLADPSLYGSFLGRPVKAFLAGLMLLAALILLAACANLGSLFAARASDRAREVALRLALGAHRRRVLRQLFTEALLVALAGGAAGLLASVTFLRALSSWNPIPRFPIRLNLEPDPFVYALALVLALLAGILFGVLPARQVLAMDPFPIVKSGRLTGTHPRWTARDLLLAFQIAICAVLVTSSLVAVRGLIRSLHTDFGFQPRGTLLAHSALTMAGHPAAAYPAIHQRLVDSVAAIPGVEAAGLIDRIPLGADWANSLMYPEETTDFRPSNAAATAVRFNVSPAYFQAAGTRLLAGRLFTDHDHPRAPRVAIVNRECARRVFGSDAAALGRWFRLRNNIRLQIVGVVEDGKYVSLTEPPRAALFTPLAQSPAAETWLVARTSGNAAEHIAPAIREAFRQTDPALPVYIEPWTQTLDFALFPARVATAALGVMGLIGALLAVTGVFGMAAYSVSKRLKELGIRMALGARRTEVLHAALGRAFKLLAIGGSAGLLLGVLAARVLAAIVYQATPRDPFVLAGVVLALLLLGLVATWIPAHRALSLNPVALLREE
ncbi:MAG: ADOP family duplicated permease [Bryobacteraceae bacterium]|nr:ADOP family duplicated permease [Bryobacteraceae bacterium]